MMKKTIVILALLERYSHIKSTLNSKLAALGANNTA
jgi:hypothetical protein